MSDKIYSIEEISSLLNKMLKNRPVKKSNFIWILRKKIKLVRIVI